MNKLTGILLLFFFSPRIAAQTDSAFLFVKTVKGDIVSFTVDNLDYLFIEQQQPG